jgi:hypothetical protein
VPAGPLRTCLHQSVPYESNERQGYTGDRWRYVRLRQAPPSEMQVAVPRKRLSPDHGSDVAGSQRRRPARRGQFNRSSPVRRRARSIHFRSAVRSLHLLLSFPRIRLSPSPAGYALVSTGTAHRPFEPLDNSHASTKPSPTPTPPTTTARIASGPVTVQNRSLGSVVLLFLTFEPFFKIVPSWATRSPLGRRRPQPYHRRQNADQLLDLPLRSRHGLHYGREFARIVLEVDSAVFRHPPIAELGRKLGRHALDGSRIALHLLFTATFRGGND